MHGQYERDEKIRAASNAKATATWQERHGNDTASGTHHGTSVSESALARANGHAQWDRMKADAKAKAQAERAASQPEGTIGASAKAWISSSADNPRTTYPWPWCRVAIQFYVDEAQTVPSINGRHEHWSYGEAAALEYIGRVLENEQCHILTVQLETRGSAR